MPAIGQPRCRTGESFELCRDHTFHVKQRRGLSPQWGGLLTRKDFLLTRKDLLAGGHQVLLSETCGFPRWLPRVRKGRHFQVEQLSILKPQQSHVAIEDH